MKIRLIGQRNNLGIGTHYANFADCLRRRSGIGHLVEEIDFINTNQFESAINSSTDLDINISFVAANIHDFFRGTIIQWTVFETTHIPVTISECLTRADQVWVPSQWGRQVLLEHGINNSSIHVVPEGVNADQYHATTRPKTANHPMKFLFVGKYETRKSITELIDAWAEAFGNDSTVQLFIKTNYFKEAPERLQQLQDHLNRVGLSNISAYWGFMSDQHMAELYESADVFVFPTKGEGWGLPIIEAAAQGLPIITVNWSAQQDYLDQIKNSCVFVDYDLVDVDCADYRLHYPGNTTWGQWAQPRSQSLVDGLRCAKNNYDTLARNAAVNADLIRQQWSWTHSVDCAVKTLYQTGCLGN